MYDISDNCRVATPKEEEPTTGLDDARLDEILLEKELDTATQDFPDFSPAGVRIDEIIPDANLEKYSPVAVVRVAAKKGYDVDVCTCMLAHEQPKARANGKWVDVQEKSMDFKNFDRVICPYCREKKLDDGISVTPEFKGVHYLG